MPTSTRYRVYGGAEFAVGVASDILKLINETDTQT
jgi:hypothetical protein